MIAFAYSCILEMSDIQVEYGSDALPSEFTEEFGIKTFIVSPVTVLNIVFIKIILFTIQTFRLM